MTKQECISVGCIPPALYATMVSLAKTLLTDPPWTEAPLWTETPWTETPLEKDPP